MTGNGADGAGLLEMAVGPVMPGALEDGAPQVAGYEILGLLGTGASGEVWLADEPEPGRAVALKILRRGGVASAEVLRREIRILAQIVHPNLVLLHHGIVTADGRQGLAMEWIDGWPLDEWLGDRPELGLEEILEVFRGIVRGVAHLHDHGVIHRDLKPANVIVDARGMPKIVDFGLARMHLQESAAGGGGDSIGVSGTLQFMAPEQAADGRGARAMPVDVYALGLIFHRMLTGKWLHPQDGTPGEILAKVLAPPPLDFRDADRRLPGDLQSILRKALARDPANRYHHAREMEADLARFSAKRPVAARTHTARYLAATFLRRQARRSLLAAALVLAGLVAAGTLYRQQRAVAHRNEANLRYAYSLTSFTLRKLASELRTGTPDEEDEPVAEPLPGAPAAVNPDLPLTAAGELDLRYYRAMLADLRSAASENHSRYPAALKSIQPALDLYCELARETPDDSARLLDAARARLTFARLLDKSGRAAAGGREAAKALGQIERLAASKQFDAAPLAPMRCDALQLLARQARAAGDFPAAVRLSRETLAACAALPAGLLVRPENENLPRLAVAAYDLATHAIVAGPHELPCAREDIDLATARCRAAFEREPASFPLACGLARCLHAQARLSLESGQSADVRPLLQEAADLLLAQAWLTKRTGLPQIWDLAVTATDWTAGLMDDPDPAVPTAALTLARRFNLHIRRNWNGREDALIQRARIYLYQSRLACRASPTNSAARTIAFALALLRPLQEREPGKLSLALLTAAALHHARTIADLPATHWTSDHAEHLARLLAELAGKSAKLTPAQRLELSVLSAPPGG